IVGAGSGALMGELTGGNVGKDALLGGVGGSIAGGVAQLGSTYNVPGGVSNAAGKYLSNQATSGVNNMMYNNGGTSTAGGSTNPYASMLSGLGALAGPVMAGMGSSQ